MEHKIKIEVTEWELEILRCAVCEYELMFANDSSRQDLVKRLVKLYKKLDTFELA